VHCLALGQRARCSLCRHRTAWATSHAAETALLLECGKTSRGYANRRMLPAKKRRGRTLDNKPKRAIPIATNPKVEGSGATTPTRLPPVIDRWCTPLPEEKSSPTKVSSEESPRIATEPPLAGNALSA